jgi:exosortase B
MNTAATLPAPAQPGWNERLPWLVAALGLALLYVPTIFDLARGLWTSDEQGHGPIILGVASWLMYQKWPQMLARAPGRSASFGWPVLAVGLALYVVGRSQEILLFEVGSAIWMLSALIVLLRDVGALRLVWFPLFFMIFMVPLPSALVDAVTLPMKMAVSYVAEHILYWAGYPIARKGVILHIGQYQLLVADACAGLHTLFTLEALGLLYLNIVRHPSWLRNVLLAILIVPIAFSANVIRVMVLTLVTYHLGDEAGQGFIHGFAGVVLFLSALFLVMATDSALRLIARRYEARKAVPS